MCNSVYTDVMQTIGVADPTLPQQPIPMQVCEGSLWAAAVAAENALGRIENLNQHNSVQQSETTAQERRGTTFALVTYPLQ